MSATGSLAAGPLLGHRTLGNGVTNWGGKRSFLFGIHLIAKGKRVKSCNA